MARKGTRARRKEPQAAQPALQVVENPAPVVAAQPETNVEVERASQAPIMTPPSAEALAAHDSFVRSPTAVVESLGIRLTPAVTRRLASIPPPPPAPSEEG